jgi:hypothetical protein
MTADVFQNAVIVLGDLAPLSLPHSHWLMSIDVTSTSTLKTADLKWGCMDAFV